MGERTWDALRCLDYVVTLPEVDPTRSRRWLVPGRRDHHVCRRLDERLKATAAADGSHGRQHEERPLCLLQFPGLRRTSSFRTSSPALPRACWCVNWAAGEGAGRVPCPSAGGVRATARCLSCLQRHSNLTLTSTLAHTIQRRGLLAPAPRTLGSPVAASGIPPAHEAFPKCANLDTETGFPQPD